MSVKVQKQNIGNAKNTVPTTKERYWRIRMKDGSENLSEGAWRRNIVGIWYGSWSASDWHKSLKNPRKQFRYLAKLRQPEGRGKFKKTDFDTGKRFFGITKNDWVIVFFDDSFHIARIHGGLKSSPKHFMNRNGEIFKYRKIYNKKSFKLAYLPDSYRLISAAGRANVHEFGRTYRALIKLLIENKDEESVVRAISKMPIMGWLDLLGPAEWESFCLGYLIKKEGFVPTGLGVGRTLPIFDLVGRNKKGIRVIAQCKKNPGAIRMPKEFMDACRDMKGKANIYFFAYGGITGSPKWIKVISRNDIQKWVNKTIAGRNYARMWYRVS